MPETFRVLDEPFGKPLGPLIARGRAADVFAYGDGLVLRRYRTNHDCLYEAAVMQHVHAHGYPVPAVAEVAGRDLVMERIDGPTMLDDFPKHPHHLFRHAATLADLLQRLHAIPPMSVLIAKHADPSTIVHLDLHPDNVMLSARGPIVIDWSNAGLGDPDAEVADLWLLMACASPPVNAIERILIGIFRKAFVRSLLRHFDRDAIAKKLPTAFALRSRDRNMSESELGKMKRLVERFASSGPAALG
jgi:aminoglycoside phosphotransferase (APT) family kinase protein